MRGLTVLYYTSNLENEDFLARVRGKLRHLAAGIPIVSVSQKPINFGHNICVGEVGLSSYNIRRQILIGAESAMTDFVALVEDDSLYPPNHFVVQDRFDDSTMYYNRKVYMLSTRTRMFARKASFFTGSIIVGRNYLIESLKKMLSKAKSEWIDDKYHDSPRKRMILRTFRSFNNDSFKVRYSIVSVDHERSMHPFMHNTRRNLGEVPGWGKADELLKKLGL